MCRLLIVGKVLKKIVDFDFCRLFAKSLLCDLDRDRDLKYWLFIEKISEFDGFNDIFCLKYEGLILEVYGC